MAGDSTGTSTWPVWGRVRVAGKVQVKVEGSNRRPTPIVGRRRHGSKGPRLGLGPGLKIRFEPE